MTPTTETTATAEAAGRILDAFAALDPCTAVVDAGAQDAATLTDYSPAGHAARAGLAASALRDLEKLTPAAGRDRIVRDHLAERLGSRIAFHTAGEDVRELHVAATGPLQMLRQAIEAAVPPADAAPEQRDAGWALVAERLADLPRALAGYAESLTLAASRGHVAARRQVELCAQRSAVWAQDAATFAARCGDGSARPALDRAAADAAQAYHRFGAFLTADLAPHAPEQEAFGEERYATWVRAFLGGEPDLRELYAWGWAELRDIEAELAREAAAILPGASVPEVVDRLDEGAVGEVLIGRDVFAGWLQNLLDDTVRRLDGVHFDIPEPLRRLESRLSATSGICYIGPSQDLTRPGRVWWQIDDDQERFPVWHVYSTAYHEGVPGHHLQIGLEACEGELGQRLNLLGGLSGCAEGWGLYAERLMDELGYYEQPGARLGHLVSQLLRAARVVIDIGLHLRLEVPDRPGELWRPEIALDWLENRVYQGQYATSELARYLGRPAQALAYKVGEKVWLDGRAAAGLEQREFHRRALALGSMGLGALSTQLAALARGR
ncbi:MAG: DUF885 domain-containing protein [Hamadaea sp.]|nr:DUF885 domain-containing protein [Hamadaea sp.]